MFQLIVDGRIGGDAEKKLTQTGKEYVTFRMAHNEKDKSGNQQTLWFSVTTWNQIGLAQYLTKGKAINVIGKPSCRLYETKDGKTEIGYDIIATSIEFPRQQWQSQQRQKSKCQQKQPMMMLMMNYHFNGNL